MAHAANILDFRIPQRRAPSIAVLPVVTDIGPARLIPGMQASQHGEKSFSSARWDSVQVLQPATAVLKQIAVFFLPEFLKRFPPSALGIAILDFSSILTVYFVMALALRPAGFAFPNPASFSFYVAAFVTFGTQEGLYRCWPVPQRTENLAIAKVVLLSALLTIFALECSPHPNVSGVLLLGCTSLCGLLLVRHVSRAIRCRDGERSGAIVLGTGIAAKKVAEAISRNSDSGLSIKAFVSEIDCLDSSTVGRIAMREFADEIIIATEDRDAARTAIQHAQRNGLDVRVVPELFGVKHNELAVECISGMPLLKIHKERLPEWSLAVKRVADVALSMIGLLVISPLLAAVAGIIKLDSAGPILYRAVRVGRKRQQFICYKFRTMARDAEAFKNELRSRNERIGASFKMSNDPRITRVGHFLRRYSLDELPQLWNVLLGDMSLVGPRRILLMTWIGTACSICPGLTSLRG